MSRAPHPDNVKKPKVTPFQQRVYDACSRIPKGKVASYGTLAAEIDCGSSQAVGQALRRNPFAPDVPCHRVVNANRELHGFGGHTHGEKLDQKRELLLSEGVEFDADGRVSAGNMISRS